MPYSFSFNSKLLISMLVVLAIGAGVWYVVWPENKADGNDAVSTRVLPVNVGSISKVESVEQTRTYTGTIRAHSRSDLAFELAGRIHKVLVDEGESVVLGQTLARLDTATLAAQLNSAKARKKQAEAVLAELENGPRQETVDAARSDFEAAEFEFKNAKAVLDRIEKLKSSGAISQDEYDRAQFSKDGAESRMNAMKQRWSELKLGTRPEKIAAQSAAVEQISAEMDEITVAIKNCKLVAPFKGIVSKRYLDAGTIASPSQPVVELIENEILEAWVGLPATQAETIKVGERYKIRCRGNSIDAQVIAKIDNLDPWTQTQSVIFRLQTGSHEFAVPGQLCELSVVTKLKKNGFWVPAMSLSRGIRGLWSVMVVVAGEDDYAIEKRDVVIQYNDGDRVLVTGTISSGDKIVIDGLHRIVNGQKVSIQQQPLFRTADNQNE